MQISVAGPSGADVKVYLEPDRNGRQQTGAAGLLRLLRAFREAAPERRVFANKAELSIMLQWRPLARVVGSSVGSGGTSVGFAVAAMMRARAEC